MRIWIYKIIYTNENLILYEREENNVLMNKIYYSFCIKDEFKIYKNVCSYKEDDIRNYSQWREYIIKYYAKDEQYNNNFIHFIINEKRLTVVEVDIWSTFVFPLEIALVSVFLSVVNDSKVDSLMVLIMILTLIGVLICVIQHVEMLKLKVDFWNDIYDIFSEKI